MSSWKEKLSLKIRSAEDIAVLCWCGTILAGAIIRLVCNKVSFKNLPEDCVGFAVLFLIQLVVAIIIGKCYTETPSAIHRKILLILGVLHSTMREIANKLKMDRSYLARTLQLANLAPDIVKLIWENRQSETLTLDKLRRGIPEIWEEQRKLFLS